MLSPPPKQSGVTGTTRTEGPPRLVLRFALYAVLSFALAAVAVLLLVRHFTTAQAERAATLHAQFVASSVLSDRVDVTDFTERLSESRKAQLDDWFRSFVLNDGTTVVAELVARDGTIVHSSRAERVGQPIEHVDLAQQTLAGALVSRISSIEARGDGQRTPGAPRATATKVLATYAPITFPDQSDAAILVLHQDYAPINDAARAAFLPVAGVFEVVLLIMCAGLIPVLRRVTKRMRTQMAEIEQRAYFDDLTGLPNRTLFHQSIERALADARVDDESVAILMMDLDRFKEINDTLGHHLGDALLQELAVRVARVLRPGDTLARLGGDEFALLLHPADKAQANDTIEKIQEELLQPFVLGGLPISAEASLRRGAQACRLGGDEFALLLHPADKAQANDTSASRSLPSTETITQRCSNTPTWRCMRPKAREPFTPSTTRRPTRTTRANSRSSVSSAGRSTARSSSSATSPRSSSKPARQWAWRRSFAGSIPITGS